MKNKLHDLFEQFEEAGLIARMNYQCCGNCGGCAITDEASKMIDTGIRTKESIVGSVFFHNQDTERAVKDGEVYLRYGDMHSTKYGVIGIDPKECGDLIVKILNTNNIYHIWDGDPNQCIGIKLDKSDFAEWEHEFEREDDND